MPESKPHIPDAVANKLRRHEITADQSRAFEAHLERVEEEIYSHAVIRHNPYTRWFRGGTANTPQVRDLVVQFSVFSNYFLPLEAKRMVNALTEEEEKKARSILCNELGVPINVRTGSIEGFRFSHDHAHIKWLRDIGESLGLGRDELGKWRLGTAATHQFLEDLERVYGSPDNAIGSGASFAVESWAGFGIGQNEAAENNNFWKELITGLESYNEKHRAGGGLPSVDVGFFQHHFDLELAHVRNVEEELAETFFMGSFDEDKWYDGARRALDAVHIFWKGLDQARRQLGD